jgi:tRNA-binding protein
MDMDDFTPAPVKPIISLADVERIDVRVGTIVAIDDIPQSAKLLKLTVDFGDHHRTILAGMKRERSNPQEIVGRQALFVVNLEPKRIVDEISEGIQFVSIGPGDLSESSMRCHSVRATMIMISPSFPDDDIYCASITSSRRPLWPRQYRVT